MASTTGLTQPVPGPLRARSTASCSPRHPCRMPANTRPFFVLHGKLDTTLPVARARLPAHHLRSISHHPVVYAELPGAEHNFDLFHSIRAEAVINGVKVRCLGAGDP